MFGHCESRHERHGKWAAGRHRGRHFGRHGMGGGGRHGTDSDDMMRAGRMLAQGDLRLVALAFIAEQPRHGYEIIKLVEEKTADWYSPSPGIIYPTLTYLEEAGYVTASTEGSKKQYAITDEGRAYLDANRDVVDAVLERLAALGERVSHWRRSARRERGEDDRRRLSPLLEAAIDNLRDAAAKRLEGDEDAEPRAGRNPRPRGDRFAADVSGDSRTITLRVEAARPSWRTALSTQSPASAHARAGCRGRAAGPGCGAGPEIS